MEIQRARYNYKQPKPRKKSTKKPFFVGVVFVILVFLGIYSAAAIGKPVSAVSAESKVQIVHDAESVNLTWPAAGHAAIGDSSSLLAASSSSEVQKPIASMAKIITALAVLDKKPIEPGQQGDIYTVTPNDILITNSYIAKNGSYMPVSTGQQLTQYQMLQGLLLPSANNIADSLAVWTFGSMEQYLEYANKLMASSGLKNTIIADASGFAPQTVSTPSDMVSIGQKAMTNPVIASIVSQKQAEIPGSGTIRNTNSMLRYDQYVGMKTGTTDEAGSCLLFAVKHGPNNDQLLVGVIMGEPNWPTLYSDVKTLTSSALAGFSAIEIAPAGLTVGEFTTPWGSSSEIKTAKALSIYGWKNRQYSIQVELDNLEAPASAGKQVGTVNVVGQPASAEAVLASNISAPDTTWRLLNYW